MHRRTRGGLVGLFGAAAVTLTVTGCSGSPGQHPPGPSAADPSTAVPTTAPPGAASGSTPTRPTGAPDPAASGQRPADVPIDHIPSGRPASWIPRGMPLDAPYREPGDRVPRFTLALFENDKFGALVAADFYWKANNWAMATLHDDPRLLICDAASCVTDTKSFLERYRRSDQHVAGGRQAVRDIRLISTMSTDTWVVQAEVSDARARLVDARGRTIKTYPATSLTENVRSRWNGRMWRVIEVSLAS